MIRLNLSEKSVYIWLKDSNNDILITQISRKEFYKYCFYDEEYENDY